MAKKKKRESIVESIIEGIQERKGIIIKWNKARLIKYILLPSLTGRDRRVGPQISPNAVVLYPPLFKMLTPRRC